LFIKYWRNRKVSKLGSHFARLFLFLTHKYYLFKLIDGFQLPPEIIAVADVCGKLVNTFADLKSVKLAETGNFKMLVSGDSISGEHKFENSFKFRNLQN
jgi:hypothetical protein